MVISAVIPTHRNAKSLFWLLRRSPSLNMLLNRDMHADWLLLTTGSQINCIKISGDVVT